MEQLIPAPEGQELNTPETVRVYFETRGISIASWCRDHGLNRNAVAALISPKGKSAGKRGKAFIAAVALGLRHPPPDGEVATTVPDAEQVMSTCLAQEE